MISRPLYMIMKRILFIILVCFIFTSCTVQEAHLVSLPDPTTFAPTPQATETPAPEALLIPDITGSPFQTDLNGIVIVDPDTHYYDYYITLNDIRIYEYEAGTYLDGKLVNNYTQTLSGKLRIIFKNKDGVIYGYGDIYTSGGGLVAFPGENMIYADILSEIDIRMMDFTVQITAPFAPVE